MKRKPNLRYVMVAAMFVVALVFLGAGVDQRDTVLLVCGGVMVVCAFATIFQNRYKG